MFVSVIVALVRIAAGIAIFVLFIKLCRFVFCVIARWLRTKILKRDDNFFSTRD